MKTLLADSKIICLVETKKQGEKLHRNLVALNYDNAHLINGWDANQEALQYLTDESLKGIIVLLTYNTFIKVYYEEWNKSDWEIYGELTRSVKEKYNPTESIDFDQFNQRFLVGYHKGSYVYPKTTYNTLVPWFEIVLKIKLGFDVYNNFIKNEHPDLLESQKKTRNRRVYSYKTPEERIAAHREYMKIYRKEHYVRKGPWTCPDCGREITRRFDLHEQSCKNKQK